MRHHQVRLRVFHCTRVRTAHEAFQLCHSFFHRIREIGIRILAANPGGCPDNGGVDLGDATGNGALFDNDAVIHIAECCEIDHRDIEWSDGGSAGGGICAEADAAYFVVTVVGIPQRVAIAAHPEPNAVG